MTDAREIWECSNCDGLFWSDENCTCNRPNWNGPASQARLTSAGFRILGPDEIDGPTVEKCAEVARGQMSTHQGSFGSQPAYVASHAIAAAIRALKEKRT